MSAFKAIYSAIYIAVLFIYKDYLTLVYYYNIEFPHGANMNFTFSPDLVGYLEGADPG